MATYDEILGVGKPVRRIGMGRPMVDPRTYVNDPGGVPVGNLYGEDGNETHGRTTAGGSNVGGASGGASGGFAGRGVDGVSIGVSNGGTYGASNGVADGASNGVDSGGSHGASGGGAQGGPVGGVVGADGGGSAGRSVRRSKIRVTETQSGSGDGAGTPQGDGAGGSDDKGRLSYVELFQKMSPYKPPTEEDIKKEKRKQKRQAIFAAIGDGISALSNLYFTSKYSPNAYDAKQGMSPKMVERWEKLKKEKEADQRAYMDGMMRAMALDDQKAVEERNWRHTLEREEVADKRYDDDIRHRDTREGILDKRYDDDIKHRNEREKVQDDQWDKTFREGIRQFNVSSAQTQQRINLEAKRLSHEMQSDNGISFTLGLGKGTITVPKAALNDSNVAFVFNKLPANVRAQVKGTVTKVKDRGGKEQVVYGPPTTDAMLIAIGTNIEQCPEAQAALKEVAGQKQTVEKKGRGY